MLTHMALPSPDLAADSQRVPKGPLTVLDPEALKAECS